MEDELPAYCRTLTITEYDGTTDPQEHLSCFENTTLLHRYTDGIKCRVFITTFAIAAQQWFKPVGAIGNFQEFRSLYLHQYASSRKLRKTKLSFFAIRQKDNETLKEYLQRFNTAALEVPSATQEVKASAFSQGLLDGDFFKSLSKKPVSKFDTLLARAAKYISVENAQDAKKESHGEKKKETKEETLPRSLELIFGTRNPHPKSKCSIYPIDGTYYSSSHGSLLLGLDPSSKSKFVGPVLKSNASIDAVCGKYRVQDVSFYGNTANKQKAVETSDNSQVLQVVTGMPPVPASGGFAPAPLAPTPPPPRVVGLVADPPQRSTSSDTSTEKLSPTLLRAIQQIVLAAIQKQMMTLAPARVATLSDVDAPKEKVEGDIHAPTLPGDRR
ncbi:UNVERIFIED_CONTAM: hypothetical protein Slati_4533700 [Sesamum latifolium]|uniref:Retrotransposon gag domain-containing protein n=1 Tax=Sesamum latifolium TaxID=2727402 RepID=A0AAW2SIJ1_9LAMI